MEVLQKFRAGSKHDVPVPWVLWHGSYRTHRSSGYGYESLTELPEVPGTGMKILPNFQKFWAGINMGLCGTGVQNIQKFRVRVRVFYKSYRSSLWGNTRGKWFCVFPTNGTKIESSGTGMNVAHNSQTFRVRVGLYRTNVSPGYG